MNSFFSKTRIGSDRFGFARIAGGQFFVQKLQMSGMRMLEASSESFEDGPNPRTIANLMQLWPPKTAFRTKERVAQIKSAKTGR